MYVVEYCGELYGVFPEEDAAQKFASELWGDTPFSTGTVRLILTYSHGVKLWSSAEARARAQHVHGKGVA